MERSEGEALKQYATAKQAEAIDAVVSHGSTRRAADALGMHHSAVGRKIQAVRKKAALQGYAPEHDMVHTVPEGFHVRGTSTLYTYGENGQKVAAQWVKSDLDKAAQRRLLEEWVADLCGEVEGLKAPQKPPQAASGDVMTCYVMGDPHAGLYAWGEEAGEDYDLATWSAQHRAAMDELVDSAPPSDEAVIVNLGDFFHADDHKSVTPGSGHGLDVDTRHAKVFREGCRTFEYLIDEALKKHPRVTVYVTKGNHDPESSFALAEVLRAVYRREERVEIIGGIKPREYHIFGKTLIGITHGDKAKPAQLSQVMAAERPEEWGRATCRRWLVGHFHHADRKEYPGCIVEIFPTLAAKDAWHSGMGYMSERAMTAVIYDREFGEKGRRIVSIREIERAPNVSRSLSG